MTNTTNTTEATMRVARERRTAAGGGRATGGVELPGSRPSISQGVAPKTAHWNTYMNTLETANDVA